MTFVKRISMFIIAFAFVLQAAVFALPSVVTVTDYAEMPDDISSFFGDGAFSFVIEEKMLSESNARYMEIDGVQSEMSDTDRCELNLGDKNLIVKIAEKNSDGTEVVATYYYYINAQTKSVSKLDMDSYMKSYRDKEIRSVGEMGVRFKAHILSSVKSQDTGFVIDEYGYIISTAEILGSESLTLNSSKYVKGIAYNKENGTDIVFDSTNDDYVVFAGVLKNIPVKHYETELVCKTYTRVSVAGEQFVVYGEPVTGNVFDIAAKCFIKDCSNVNVSKIVFDYLEAEGRVDDSFSDSFVTSEVDGTTLTVKGGFDSTYSEADNYNIYLVTYSELGSIESVEKSDDNSLLQGNNTFEEKFEIDDSAYKTKAFVLTSDIRLAAYENKILWAPSQDVFYDILSSGVFDAETDFSTLLDSDGDISIIEGISIASALQAQKNGKKVTVDEDAVYEHCVEMDDASKLIDLSERNSINLDGINFGNATGEIDEENGYLIGTSKVKSNGGYDPQVTVNGLLLEARKYNKITVRMKFEKFAGSVSNIYNQSIQIFFKTNINSGLSENKSSVFSLKKVINPYDWFEFELDMSSKEDWNNFITGIRLDPTNANVKFYIDYIKFSKSDSAVSTNWYDRFLDYAYENDIVEIGDFTEAEFNEDITRQEFLTMLVKALGEEEFATINGDICAIPDVDKNSDNAEVFLMLYKAGITLGFDEEGNLSPGEGILRSEVSSIFNRIIVNENRLKGSVDAVWEDEDYINDYEFNDASDLSQFTTLTRMTDSVVSDGAYSFNATWDSYMIDPSVSIDADKYTKIKVRIKADYASEPTASGMTYNIFFKPEDFDGDITHYSYGEAVADYYLDAAGWYVFEIDMCLHPKWQGNINYFRFDPMNSAGSYKIDYIRFIKSEYADYPDQESLINAGYTATRLMLDEDFERGFYVAPVDQSVASANHGLWQNYCDTSEKPLWQIGPWWQGTGEGFEKVDLWNDRDTTTDEYTLADKFGINTITYNPELKSITQRLNATRFIMVRLTM